MISSEELQSLVFTLGTGLSSLESEALRLYLDGRSYDQMGEILECDCKTIDNALQRVKRKILAHQATREVLRLRRSDTTLPVGGPPVGGPRCLRQAITRRRQTSRDGSTPHGGLRRLDDEVRDRDAEALDRPAARGRARASSRRRADA